MSSSDHPNEDRERIDTQLAQESDNLTPKDLAAVRKALRDEQSRSEATTDRRDYLKAGGLAAAGLLAGAGGTEAASEELTGRAAASSGSTSGDLSHVEDLTVEKDATIKGNATTGSLDTEGLRTFDRVR